MTTPWLFMPDLSLLGVADPGVPNRERVVIRPTQTASLYATGIAVGVIDPRSGGASPIFDHTFWFPNVVVRPPSWVFVFTGPGSPSETKNQNGETIRSFFWNRQETIFANLELIPVLFRLGSVVIGRQLRA